MAADARGAAATLARLRHRLGPLRRRAPFDEDALRTERRWPDADELFRRYYETVAEMAATGVIDVVGHLDLPKIFGRRPGTAVAPAEEAALDAIAAAGVRSRSTPPGCATRSASRIPSPDLLAQACALGIGITFGSDAHQVGRGRRRLRRGPGARQVCRICGRRAAVRPGRGPAAVNALGLQRVAAIYNPASGGGEHRRDLPLMMELLRAQEVEVSELPTEHAGHGTDLARRAVAGGVDAVCVLGGDGTVNEVINGIAESGVPLIIMPTGTVNVLALELGIPLEPADACPPGRRGPLSWIDLGQAGDRYFALMAGVGLDAMVVNSLNPALKKVLREAAFALQGWRRFFRSDFPLIRVETAEQTAEGYFAVYRQLGQLRRLLRYHHRWRACATACWTSACWRRSRRWARRTTGWRRSWSPTSGIRMWSTGAPRAPTSAWSTASEEVLVQTDGEVAGTLPLDCRMAPRRSQGDRAVAPGRRDGPRARWGGSHRRTAPHELVHRPCDAEEVGHPVERRHGQEPHQRHGADQGRHDDLAPVQLYGAHDRVRHLLLLEDRQQQREARVDPGEHAGVDVERADDRGTDARRRRRSSTRSDSSKPTTACLLAAVVCLARHADEAGRPRRR